MAILSITINKFPAVTQLIHNIQTMVIIIIPIPIAPIIIGMGCIILHINNQCSSPPIDIITTMLTHPPGVITTTTIGAN